MAGDSPGPGPAQPPGPGQPPGAANSTHAWAPRSYTADRAALASGELSPEEVVEACLERVERWEPELQALLPDETPQQRRSRMLGEAQAVARHWPNPAQRPPLYGAIVGVKDLFHARGFPTRAGSRLPAEAFLEPNAPGRPTGERDEASVVTALRESGAIILGKTVSTEFAYFAPGPTRNPWDPAHTPGGSSSGSAAAVAAGMCHLALGTQTIGSISRPASFCGITGWKPGFGRVPRDGVVPCSPDADHVGPLAADTAGLIAVLEALDGGGGGDLSADRRPGPEPGRAAGDAELRQLGPVLVPDDAYLDQCDHAGRAGLSAMLERLQGLGVSVRRVAIMDDIAEINARHRAMVARDFAEVHAVWLERYGEHYHERSRELAAQGAGVSDEERERARSGRLALRRRLEEALERHAARLWMAPATVGEAPAGIDTTGDPVINLPWTHAGLPTVVLPLHALPGGRGPAGLPLGVQLACAHGADAELLRRASLLESRL